VSAWFFCYLFFVVSFFHDEGDFALKNPNFTLEMPASKTLG